MANISCPGGHSFSDADFPSDIEGVLIPDTAIEGLVAQLTKLKDLSDDFEAAAGYAIMTSGSTTYKCPTCGRLLVFRNGITEPGDSYLPEG